MKILCVFGQHNYGDPARGEGVEYTHFLPALRALGHEVLFFESFSRALHADFGALNRELLKRIEAWQPDLVFTVLMMAEVWLETVALMRSAGCRVVNWATDDSWKYREFSRLIAAEFDLWATTCPDARSWYMADGIGNVHVTQWAASSSWLASPKLASECRYTVSFVGSAYGSRPARISALHDAGIPVECFGHGWPSGPVSAERIPGIVSNSVLSLNFSEAGQGSGKQIKARIFEVPAAGGMLLTEATPYLNQYFVPGAEVMEFTTDQELVSMARALLSDPESRDAIAIAGHERVVSDHTYEIRLERLLAHLEKENGVVSGTRRIDWDEFARIEEGHRATPPLKLLRALLCVPCTLLWGPRRGPRAARRILFEICWRIFGRHTYTAKGWPGRLFYRET